MPITAEEARRVVEERLRADEKELHAFGSALPGHASRPRIHLIVTREEEHDCGWVFCYDSREHAIDGDVSFALAGNWPFIVSREDGSIQITGRRALSEYLDELRKRQKPNQSLEPTRVLGTSAAEPPRVPSTRVAHL